MSGKMKITAREIAEKLTMVVILLAMLYAIAWHPRTVSAADTGALTVYNQLNRPGLPDFSKSYFFRVELSESIDGLFGDMTFNNGVADISITGEGSVTATGLPTSATYTVTALAVDPGWFFDSNDSTGTISTTASEVHFTTTPISHPIIVKGVWDDGENQNGLRPEWVDVHLYADDVDTGETATLSNGNSWTKTAWERLPMYKDQEKINYTVKAEDQTGYSIAITKETGDDSNDYAIIYTLKFTFIAETEFTTKIVWDDGDNQDGIRPESLEINLYKQVIGAAPELVDHATLSAANNWVHSWGGSLPTYENGKEITYGTGFTSQKPDGYESSRTLEGNIETCTISHTPEEIELTTRIVWNDGNDQDGKRPATVTVELNKTVQEITHLIDSVDLSGDSNWSYTWQLPKYENGNEITYGTGVNVAPTGYVLVSIGKEGTVETRIVRYIPEKTTITGTVLWVDDDDRDGKRPSEVRISLYANGVQKAIYSATSPDWTYQFDNFDKYSDGTLISYSVRPDITDDYSYSVNNFDVTLTHIPEETELTAFVIWVDDEDQDGIRPPTVTVQLLADEIQTGPSATLTEMNSWSCKWEQLPKYENAAEINYTVKLTDLPEGYVLTSRSRIGSSCTLTLKHETEKIDLTAKIQWDDNMDQDGKRPASVRIKLLEDQLETGKVGTLSEAANWTVTFMNLPKYKQRGVLASYSMSVVYEDTPDYVYSTGLNEGSVETLVLKHIPEKIAWNRSVIWLDDNDQDALRPASVDVSIMADGVTNTTITLSPANNWTYQTELDRYSFGQEIVYSDQWDTVSEYTLSIENDNAIYTHTAAVTSCSVRIIWDDVLNQDDLRPDDMTVELYEGNSSVPLSTASLSAANSWSYTWSALNEKNHGTIIPYVVRNASTPDGYTSTVNGDAAAGYTITCSHTTEQISIQVDVAWDDGDNSGNTRPASIKLNLYGDGTLMTTKTQSVGTAAAPCIFDGLQKNRAGRAIVYTVKQDPITGYDTQYTQTTSSWGITNTLLPTTGAIRIAVSFSADSGSKALAASDTSNTKITVTGPGGDKNYVVGTAFTNGVLVLDDLELGEYTISEDVNTAHVEGYTLTVTGNNTKVTVEAAKTKEISIVNTYSGTEVWIPYVIESDEKNYSSKELDLKATGSGNMAYQVKKAIRNGDGKWVRYAASPKNPNHPYVTGWYTTLEGTTERVYYFDYQTGMKATGYTVIAGELYRFDSTSGALIP